MKNSILSLGKKTMLPLVVTILFFSCKKDSATIDEYRYKRYLNFRRLQPPVDSSQSTDTVITVPSTKDTTTILPPTTDTVTTALPPTPIQRKNLIFESTFENISNWLGGELKTEIGSVWKNYQHCCSYSIGVAPIKRNGTGAIKFELKKGDALVSGSSRSEITGPWESETKFERWYGVSFYVTANDDGLDQSLIQWHQNQSGGIPPMALWISNNQWMMVSTASGDITRPSNRYTSIGAVESGKWTDFVFHIKWSNSTDGLIEIYKGGKLIKTVVGTTGYTGGNYMKLGIYKWTWSGKVADGTSRIIYADDMRIGNGSATYGDVAP